MIFQTKIFIPFHLVDAAGVLFFSHSFTLAHMAFEQFITENLDIPWACWFQNSEWVVPIKSAEADYLHPLLAGQICTIKIQVIEVRQSSFVLDYLVIQNAVECCKMKTLHVFCNRPPNKKMAIPQVIKTQLEALAMPLLVE